VRFFVLMLLLFVTGCAIPSINPPPQITTDRSWVPADAVIYGQDLSHGFFRFALNQPQPQSLGKTIGFLPEALVMSPDKTEIYADSNGPGTDEPHLIYNTKTGTLRDLGPLMAPFTFEYAISPDWHYIAWSNFRDPGEHIVDLSNNTVQTLHLPAQAEKDGLLINPAWVTDGNLLVTNRPATAGGNWTYWMINLASGTIKQIEGQNQMGNITYLENGHPVTLRCGTCSGPRSRNPVATPSGALVYISKVDDLVVKDPDGSLNIVAKHIPPPPMPPGIACDCGPQGKFPAIWTVFDGDVVLYSFGRDQSGGQQLWVYGIAEHETSPLDVAPIELAF